MNLQGSVAVFLGPSLRQRRARAILEAAYYPPARKGDVYRVMTSGVDTIVLIDGVFHNTPSVWQRELLDAVEEGFAVYGASSMGALRAAELGAYGMEGHGVVFEWYRDGLIEGDDEVALLHASEEFEYRALSVPLVNIRYALRNAVAAHALAPEREDDILDYVKGLPYPERSFEAVRSSPPLAGAPPAALSRLEPYLSAEAADVKMLDAVGLLQHVKAERGRGARAPRLEPARTSGVTRQRYERMLMTGFHTTEGLFDGAEVLRRASESQPFTRRMRAALALRRFVLEWANENQVRCPEGAVAAAADGFISGHGGGDFGAWLRRNGLTHASFATSLAEAVLIDWVISEGPAAFGLKWDAAAEAAAKSLFDADPEAFHRPPTLANLPRRTRAGHEARAGSPDDGSYSQYAFLVAWAERNGVSPAAAHHPTESARGHAAAGESPDGAQPDPHPPGSPEAWRRALSRAAWALNQGTEHFGLDGIFELDFVRALQMTDQVEPLLSAQAVTAAR